MRTRIAVVAGAVLPAAVVVVVGAFAGSAVAGAPTLVISEVQYDPKSPESDATQTEWVELHNYGDADVSLKGMRLTSGTRAKPHDDKQKAELPDVTVKAGGYAVIAIGTKASYDGLGLPPADAYLGEARYAWLGNSGDGVALRSADGQEIDEVVFDAAAPWPEVKLGASIQFVPPPKPDGDAAPQELTKLNDDPAHWVGSTPDNADTFEAHGTGTPGAPPKAAQTTTGAQGG